MNSMDVGDNLIELLHSVEMLQLPDIIQELFHKMNSKIDSLNNKLNLLQHNCEDAVTKEHLNTISATKVDVTDFLNTINNIDKHIKQKPSMEEIKYLSEEKLSKSDLNGILSDYVHKKDLEDFMETNLKTYDFNKIKNSTNNKLDEAIIQLNKKISNLPSKNDVNKISNALANKVNLSELKNILAQKVDKSEITQIIKSNIDMNYINSQLQKKLDIFNLEKIQNDLNTKSNTEEIDKIQEELDKKIDVENLNDLIRVLNNKLDKKDVDNLVDKIIEKQNETYDAKIKALDIDFDRFIESVKAQFKSVNNAVNKLSKDKTDKIYFEERLNNKLDNKILINEFDKQNKEVNSKINDIIIRNKENIESLNMKFEELDLKMNNQIESLKDDIRNIIKELNSLTNNSQYNFDLVIKEKNNFDFFKNEITNKLDNLFDKIESKIDSNFVNKNLIRIQEDLKNYINEMTQEKITYNEMENIIKNINERNNENLTKNKKELNNKINNINTQIINLDKNKINSEQLNLFLDNKINAINNEINKRAFISDITNINNKLKQINDMLAQKLDESIYGKNHKEVINLLNKIESESENTYKKKEEDNLLSQKLNINSFNSVIKELNKLIDTKLDIIDYQKYIDIQEIINNIYLTEMATGIWKWVSSKVKNGYIPLEIEYYNTMRDNFLWEEDRTSLMIINKGIYNIKVVIFTDELDTNITLVINGENLVKKSLEKNRDNSMQNIKYNFNKIYIDEIIKINDKVRISLLFSGKNSNAEGFMKISTIHYEQEKDLEIKNVKAMEERLNNSKINININNNENMVIPLLNQENIESS